jgi:hypothetical protein
MWYLADVAAVSGDETDLLPDEHLCPRTEGRFRASTSGYGEVRVAACVWVIKWRHVEVTGTDTHIAAVTNGCG